MSPDIFKTLSRKFKRGLEKMRSIFRRKKSVKKSDKNLAMQQVLKARHAGAVPSAAQWKQLPRLLSANERKMALFAFAALTIAGLFLITRTYIGEKTSVAAIGGEYTEGLIGVPQLINPLYSSTSDVDTDLASLIYSGLMRFDSKDGLVPDLADSYEISEDKKEYTFTIREDAKWHDGNPVRAEDVVFTVSAIQTKEYRSPLELSFEQLKVEQINDKTVKFTLNEPFAPFLTLMTVGILPSHIWQEISPLNAPLADLNKKPIGSGPYKFEKLVKDSKGNIRSYTLVRNPNYYHGAPNIEYLNFKFYPEITSAIEALRNKNVEGLSFLPLEVVEDFKNDSSVQLIFPSLGQYVGAFINQEHNNILKNKTIREAIALSIDKEALVNEVLSGYGNVVKSFILPGMTGYYPEINVQIYDVSAAQKKLDDAGWTLKEGETIRTKDDETLAIELVTLDTAELTMTAEKIKNQLEKVGIQLNIRIVNQTDFQNDILRNRNYDILLSGEQYGIDPDPYAFWHSSQKEYPGLNLTGFSNRKADELIETGRSEGDPEKRKEAYQKLQEMVADDIAAIFLFQPTYSYAVSSKIQNIEIPRITVPADRFSRVNEWFIKTRKQVGED